MQRERDSNGRFRSPVSSAASHERARGQDGSSIAQPSLPVADNTPYVAHHAESAGSPMTAPDISRPNPSVGTLAASALPSAFASNDSGAMAATGTINAPSHSSFAAPAACLPTGELPPSDTDTVNGTTSANGTRNAPLNSLSEATDRLPTTGLVPDAAHVTDPTTTAVSRTIASSLWTSLTGLQCPQVPGLLIDNCGDVPAMSVSQFVDLAMDCLSNPQSDDNCRTGFCAMFRSNPELQYLVLALDKILRISRYAKETIGPQILRARSLLDYLTDPNPLSEINGLQEVMAHAGGFDLLGVAKHLILKYAHLLKARPIGGITVFAVIWFLKWYRPGWWQGNNGRVNVNMGARVEEVQEAEEGEELPTDNTPAMFAENTPITLIHKRRVGRGPQLQYRFHIENQPHEADNWASIKYLTTVFGSEEALQEAIRKYDSTELPYNPKFLPKVAPLSDKDARGFHLGRALVR